MQTVSPNDYPGTAGSETDRIQWALDYGRDHQIPVSLAGPPNGAYWTITATLNASIADSNAGEGAAYSSAPAIHGGGAWVRVDPALAAPLDYMMRLERVTEVELSGIKFNASGKAKGILSTSWLGAGAPSQNCRWSNIDLHNATGEGDTPMWNATGNNDSVFDQIVIDGGRYAEGQTANLNPVDIVGVYINAPGGHTRLHNLTIFRAEIVFGAQSLTLLDCVTSGIRAIGNDDNVLTILGGYHYASTASGTNIHISDGSYLFAGAASGRFENHAAGGTILGGGGTLMSGFRFDGAYIFVTGTATGARLVGPDLKSGQAGYKQIVDVRGIVNGIDLNETAASPQVLVSLQDVSKSGYPKAIRYLGGAFGITEDAERMSYAHRHPGWGTMGISRSYATGQVGPGATAQLPVDGFPVVGTLHVRCTNGNCPKASFLFDRGSGSISRSASYPGAGNSELTASISGGVVNLQHSTSGEVTVFLTTANGI